MKHNCNVIDYEVLAKFSILNLKHLTNFYRFMAESIVQATGQPTKYISTVRFLYCYE